MILSVSPQLHAEGFSYNYIDAQYATSDTDVSGSNIDGKGYSIGGSFALSDNIAFTAGYNNSSYDFDIDTNGLDFGIDYHMPVAGSTDIVLGVSVVKAEISQPLLGSEDDTGNMIKVGIRHKIAPKAELNIGVSRVDIFDDSSTGFDAALFVEVSNNLYLGIGYGSSDDTDVIGFGVRAGF